MAGQVAIAEYKAKVAKQEPLKDGCVIANPEKHRRLTGEAIDNKTFLF